MFEFWQFSFNQLFSSHEFIYLRGSSSLFQLFAFKMPETLKTGLFTRSDEFYKVPNLLMLPMFVISNENSKGFSHVNVHWIFWCAMPMLIFLSSLQIVFAFVMFQTGFDLASFCFIAQVVAYQTTAFSKIISITISSSKLNNLFELLNDLHPKTYKEQVEYKIFDWLQRTKNLMFWYAFIQIIMIANYVVIPFYGYIRVFITTGVWKMNLLLLFWLPSGTDTVAGFYIVYMLQSWLSFSTSLSITSSDLTLLAIVNLACAHFDYIQRTLSKLTPKPDSISIDLETVKSCVIIQNTVIEWVLRNNIIFREKTNEIFMTKYQFWEKHVRLFIENRIFGVKILTFFLSAFIIPLSTLSESKPFTSNNWFVPGFVAIWIRCSPCQMR